MLGPEHGYLQHLDLASDFNSCFSSVYCDRCYPPRLILDARKKKRLDCQCHWKLEKANAYAGVSCLPRRKYHSMLRDDVDSSRVKDDMDVLGLRVRSGASLDCDSADGRNDKLENDWKKKQ